MSSDCLFCRMAADEIPVEKLHDDDLCFAIRDISPRAPVHCMVIPKDHIPTARDLNDRYFAGRPDGLRMSTGEDFLIATT